MSPSRHGGSRILIVCAILLVAVAALALPAYHWWRSRPDWRPVLTWDPSITLNAAELVKNWGTRGQAVSLPAGGPYHLEPGQWLVITTVHEPEDVRVTIDAEWLDRIDAIELVVRADGESTAGWWMVPRSMNCQFGGYSGVESSLSINRQPGFHGHQGIVPAAFVKGQRHRLTLESHDGFARTQLDGRPQIELAELAPLGGLAADRVAIRSWVPIRIHAIQVERVRPGEQVSALRVGDALAANGALQPALTWYRRLANDHRGTHLAALAWARIGACAAANPAPSSDLQEALERLTKDHPEHPLRDQVAELDVLHRWKTSDFPGALKAMEALLARRPDTRLPMRMNSERPGAIPAPYGRRLADLLLRVPGLTQVDLNSLGLSDIGFLAGRQLTDLNLSGNPVADIRAIQGMPLQRLNLAGTQVVDLAPVRGMPLRILTLAGSAVTDLAPLAGLRLEELDINSTGIADLTPLRGQPLVRLGAARTPVASLEPLAGMPLQNLSVSDSQVRDLGPLQGMPLHDLDISACQVASLDPVASPELVMLRASGCPIADLTPLARAVKLKGLELPRTAVTTIDALAGLPIERLILDDLPIDQVTSMQGMPIQVLSIMNTRVTALDSLEGAPLRVLYATGSAIVSVRPLARSPLEYLDIGDAPVTDLSELAPIASLRYLGTGGSTPRPDRPAAADQFSMQGRTDLAAMVQGAALSVTDPTRLRALAMNIGGHQRLMIGRHMSWEAANALAEAADAMLVCPRDPGDLHTVLTGIVVDGEIWSGLTHGDGATRLPDGTALPDLIPAGRFTPGTPIHLYWAGGGQGCAWSSPPDNRNKMVMLEWPRVVAKGAATP